MKISTAADHLMPPVNFRPQLSSMLTAEEIESMSRRYTVDQLHAGMLDLVGEGNLGDRVYAALMNTHALKSTTEDFPDPDDRHKWAELQERVTGIATATSDRKAAYRNWVDSVDGSQLQTVAHEFLALFSSAAQELGAENEERRGRRHRSVRNSIVR